MRNKKVSDFLSNELVDYASYSTLRMIASAIDGQKNTSRKILHTILTKNIKDKIKVSQLSSKMAEYTEFLHGDASSVISGMAQDFTGTNNMPLLAQKGNFGTRFKPEASAPRYIYTYGDKETFSIFNRDDNDILIKQTFEGTDIEPLFYVPNLPVLAINGAGPGMASGFKQWILPRNPEQVKTYIKNKLQGKKPRLKLEPYYNGFNGTIEQGDNPNQWYIKGKCEKLSITKVLITELPVNTSLSDYIKELDKLEDDNVIRSYKDMSTDSFRFEVTFNSADLKKLSDDRLLSKLKLVKTISELFNALDENNQVKDFENIINLIDYYYNVKLNYVALRKEYILSKLLYKISVAESKYNYVTAVIDDKILLKNKTKLQISAQIKPLDNIIPIDDNYNYLINMPMHSVSKDTLKQLLDDVKKYKQEYKELELKTIEEIWLSEI